MLLRQGDTIVVLDNRRRRLARFSRAGEYLDSPRLELPRQGPLDLQEVSGLDGSVVSATFVTPLEPASSPPGVIDTMPLAGRYDLATGRLLETAHLQHPRRAYASGWSGLMGYPHCTDPARRHVVMVNRWYHQAAILSSPAMRVERMVSTPDAWPALVTREGSEIGSPRSFVLGAACGSDEFVAMQFLMDPEDPQGSPQEGWVARWTYAGDLVQWYRTTETDSLLYGVPVGYHGEHLYVRNNSGLDFPALVVLRVPGGSD